MKKGNLFILTLFFLLISFKSFADIKAINISSTPSNAELTINGKYVGQTPVSDIKIDTNKYVKIKLEHEEAYTMEQTREILPDDNPDISISLDLKSSYISFKYVPSGYDISVNDEEIGTTPLSKYKVFSGTNKVGFVSKNNNSSFTKSINVAGGQTYEFSPSVFVVGKNDRTNNDTYQENQRSSAKNVTDYYQKQLFLSFGFGATGSSLKEDKLIEDLKTEEEKELKLTYSGGIDIGLEYRFKSGIFMGVEYGYDFNTFDLGYERTGVERTYINPMYRQDTIYCMPAMPSLCNSTQIGPYTQAKNNVTTQDVYYQPVLDSFQTITANLGFTLFKFLSLYGRGGVAIAKLKYDVDFGSSQSIDTLFAPAYGGGVRINFTKNFSVDGMYLYTKFDVEGFDEAISQYKVFFKFFF